MKLLVCGIMVVLSGLSLVAAPPAKLGPVASGYPNWYGLTEKNHISGREITASDLRHKIAVIVEIEPSEKLQDHLLLAGRLAQLNGWAKLIGHSYVNWDAFVPPRSPIVVVSMRNTRKHEEVLQALEIKTKDHNISQAVRNLKGNAASVYEDVSFEGAPDTTGKRPYYYVMGATGTEPIMQGELTAANLKDVQKKISAQSKKQDGDMAAWKPFFGTIETSKYHPQIQKVIEKAKSGKPAPMAPVEKSILKDVTSKDEETARTAQIIYDALNQTRNDLFTTIIAELSAAPFKAYADAMMLVKYWPQEKKRLENFYMLMKKKPELDAIGKMFCKMVVWIDPEFTCKNKSEAKKITTELGKMKKSLGKLKESQDIQVQNAALLLDLKVDELIDLIPTKVPEN